MPNPGDISHKAVRDALARICRKGAETYWILETADILLDLRVVRVAAATPKATDEELAGALIQVLETVVADIRGPDKILLTICLPLDEQYLGMSAQERQRIAGQKFRGGKRPVTWGTIRKVHLRRAIDRLATLLLYHEENAAS